VRLIAIRSNSRARQVAVGGLAAFSALATLPILAGLIAFDSRPGEGWTAPEQWPRGSSVDRSEGEAQVVVFVHPFCACTSATIAELERLSARHQGSLPSSVTFLVVRPSRDAGWTWRELPEIRRGLPAVKVVWDDGAAEAVRFHAATSGTVLLYGPSGKLLFQGGVTESRGHEGDNSGLDEFAKALTVSAPVLRHSSVFGCALGSGGADAKAPTIRQLAQNLRFPASLIRAAGHVGRAF
jgi:hypothetical protein